MVRAAAPLHGPIQNHCVFIREEQRRTRRRKAHGPIPDPVVRFARSPAQTSCHLFAHPLYDRLGPTRYRRAGVPGNGNPISSARGKRSPDTKRRSILVRSRPSGRQPPLASPGAMRETGLRTTDRAESALRRRRGSVRQGGRGPQLHPETLHHDPARTPFPPDGRLRP